MTTSSATHHHTRPLDALATSIVVLLCLSWGFNQVAVKLALHDIPPLMQSALRSFVAALIVAAVAKARGQTLLARDGTLWPGIAAGVLFGAEFILIYQGLVYTTATRGVLFIYLAPFFVVLGARVVLPADRFTCRNGRALRSPSPACWSRSACRRRRSTRARSSAT